MAVTPQTVADQSLTESSGLAFSKLYPNRIYHINDSGSAPEFFITDSNGLNSLKVPVQMGFFIDTEDLAVGPCLGESSCLVIGDIGDNLRFRPNIQFYFFKESNLDENKLRHLAESGKGLAPDLVLSVGYPDGPHNSEGFFLDEKGNLTLISKEKNGRDTSVYQLPFSKIKLAARYAALKDSFSWPNKIKFKFIRKFNLKNLLPAELNLNTEITSADLNVTGKTVALLTYTGVIEVKTSSLLLTRDSLWQANQDFNYIPFTAGPQQEALAYIPGSRDLLISSEMGSLGLTPMAKLICTHEND